MKLDIRYANHPDDSKHYDTKELRAKYLIERVFAADEILLTYSHQDRIITGGVYPVQQELVLEAPAYLASEHFLERRELGSINIGGPGYILLDGIRYEMASKDGIYIGKGVKTVVFGSKDAANPAKFYLASAPAHHSYKTVHIPLAKSNPRNTGTKANMNLRTIHQYLNDAVCQTCQLQMGMTFLNEGSGWNTMPVHTHERRMEVYFYFDLGSDDVVFHLMGKPNETRHIVVENEQAVISPSFSIHAGIGTKNYAFIWAMCGENKDYDDMDHVKKIALK